MIKEQFFPTTIYAKDVQLDNDLFTREVVRWSNEDQGIKRTNMNGWHSHTDMHKIPVFKPLVDELFKMQFEVFNEEHLDREPVIGNMWANINPPGGFMLAHMFPIIGSLAKCSSLNTSNCILNNSSTKGLNTGILCISV